MLTQKLFAYQQKLFQTFFRKRVAFLGCLWYNIMRLRVPLLSHTFLTEVYRSGHNGLDSKSSGE